MCLKLCHLIWGIWWHHRSTDLKLWRQESQPFSPGGAAHITRICSWTFHSVLHIFCYHFLQCEYGWAAGYQEIGKEACLHLSSSNGLLLFILYTSCSRDYFALSSKTLMLLPTFSFSFFFCSFYVCIIKRPKGTLETKNVNMYMHFMNFYLTAL